MALYSDSTVQARRDTKPGQSKNETLIKRTNQDAISAFFEANGFQGCLPE